MPNSTPSKTTKILTIIGTMIGLATGAWGLWEKIDSKFEEMRIEEKKQIEILVDKKVEEYYSNKKGSLSSDLGEELNVDRKDVASEIGQLYEDFYVLHPTIQDELHVVDIGLKYDKDSEEIYYIHTDGKRYNVFRDEQSDWYYFMDQYGNRRTCK